MNITAQTVLKVAAASDVNKVAGALANMVRTHKQGSMRAIGVNAVNQMVKAMAVTEYFLKSGDTPIKASFNTAFEEVEVNGEKLTAMLVTAKGSKIPQRVNGKFVKAEA